MIYIRLTSNTPAFTNNKRELKGSIAPFEILSTKTTCLIHTRCARLISLTKLIFDIYNLPEAVFMIQLH